jgi:hypothetical protein
MSKKQWGGPRFKTRSDDRRGGLRSPAGGRPRDPNRWRPWEGVFTRQRYYQLGLHRLSDREVKAFIEKYLAGKLTRFNEKKHEPTVQELRKLELEEEFRRHMAKTSGSRNGRPRNEDVPVVQMDFYHKESDKTKKASTAQKQQEALEFARRHGLPGYN